MPKVIADVGWNLDHVLAYIQATGNVQVEEDNYGNICLYPNLSEDEKGRLIEGSKEDALRDEGATMESGHEATH